MSDLLLAKPKLPPGFIDLSVGEPRIVKECLSKYVELENGHFVPDANSWEYPDSVGYKPLVDLLEEKHQAPVIITNGAKQALGAVFYALAKMGYIKFGMKSPYWCLIPPLGAAHGLECRFQEPGFNQAHTPPYLLLAPNNPDGQCPNLDILKEYAGEYSDRGIPFIHDAAYFTHTYLPPSYELGPIGDVQIFSISKMFGLSGLRVGYTVCYNKEFYSLIKQYMEMMTVGVSSISQLLVYNLFNWEKKTPASTKEFEDETRGELIKAKKLMKALPPEILEVPNNIEDIPGMFGWFKVGPKANFQEAKVNIIRGDEFGMPGYIRLNLAVGLEQLAKVVARLCYYL